MHKGIPQIHLQAIIIQKLFRGRNTSTRSLLTWSKSSYQGSTTSLQSSQTAVYRSPHREVILDGSYRGIDIFHGLAAFQLVHLAVQTALWAADWLSSIKVADPSTIQHPAFQDAVDILFFAPRPEGLPRPDCVGQLIRLHRCKVWQGSYF